MWHHQLPPRVTPTLVAPLCVWWDVKPYSTETNQRRNYSDTSSCMQYCIFLVKVVNCSLCHVNLYVLLLLLLLPLTRRRSKPHAATGAVDNWTINVNPTHRTIIHSRWTTNIIIQRKKTHRFLHRSCLWRPSKMTSTVAVSTNRCTNTHTSRLTYVKKRTINSVIVTKSSKALVLVRLIQWRVPQ